MLTRETIKAFTKNLGADDCGIASAERFAESPKGFAPTDIYSKCKSVVVVARHMPAGCLEGEEMITYNHAAYEMYKIMDKIAIETCYFIEQHGYNATLVPADVPYRCWDAEENRGMGILSLKHAAVLAGMGIMGKSTIFIHPEYGNMCYLGALLTDCELEPDPLVTDMSCPDGCSICQKVCPVGAIHDGTVEQKLCRSHSIVPTGRNWDVYECSECRKKCPFRKQYQQRVAAKRLCCNEV